MMKKRGILLAVSLSLFVGGLPSSPTARAAACANVSSFGAVTLQIPELSAHQDQLLWVRVQGASGDRLLVEINGSECHELTLQEHSPDTWSWQTLQADGGARLLTFPAAENNFLKLIGLSNGLRVDRVLVTKPDCTPEDFGNNCRMGSVALTSGETPEVTALPAPKEPLNGFAHLSPTVQNAGDEITALTYTVGGQTLQRETSSKPFDTTLLENGRHTVHITTTLRDGEVIREMVAVDIKNPENPLSPVVRWLKHNRASIKAIGVLLLLIAVSLAVVRMLHHRRRSKRERTFRGL